MTASELFTIAKDIIIVVSPKECMKISLHIKAFFPSSKVILSKLIL